MKIIAKRYIDEYAPGAELVAGRYEEATLKALLDKGHFVIADDAEPGTAAEADPKKAAAADEKRRAAALKAFARGKGQKPAADVEPPQAPVVERIPEAGSDTVTRVHTPDADADDDKSKKSKKRK